MIRVSLLTLFVIGIVLILNLKYNRSLLVNNQPFDFEQAEAEHLLKKKLIEELSAPPPTPKKVSTPKPAGPLVELSTEELKRGHQLYTKCIICHGKSGAGKKSQKAPAIGGQHDWYLKDQLNLMQKKIRVNQTMYPYIKNLSPQDIEDLANYISKLPWGR